MQLFGGFAIDFFTKLDMNDLLIAYSWTGFESYLGQSLPQMLRAETNNHR